VLGYDLIHLAQRWLAYLMIAMLTLFTAAVGFRVGMPAGAFDWNDFHGVPFLAQFFAAAAYQISWSIYVSDYSRYLPRDVSVRATFWWTYIGAFIGGSWMMLVGTVAAALSPKMNVAAAVQSAADAAIPGLGSPLVFASLLGLITITSLNFYGASLTLLGVVDSFKKLQCTVSQRMLSLLALAITSSGIALLASHDFINSFEVLLAVLLYLFTPWTAVTLVDFYVVRKGHYSVREIFNPNGMYGQWNWRGLLSYAVGFVAMIPFFSTALYTGPIAKALGGADIAMLVGLPVSALVYLLACRSMDLQDDQRRALAADVGLDPDDR
jgi:purine-cytosine permease-like protein